tara:strand:- start:1459 stop:1887 length:429 start_codon:yes stop_codon:yes gene_type:complete
MKKLIKKILRETQKGTYHRSGNVEEWRINPYVVKVDNYMELLDAVNKLPDTIKSITIPTEVQIFNPDTEKIHPSNDGSWKERVKQLVMSLARRGEVLTYSLSSYFGTTDKNYDTHPYYISVELPGSKKFAERMRDGEHGALD